MRPRNPDDAHRAATPLELFFDLVFVVAIAQAASGLHHSIADAHAVDGIVGYLFAFFGIWWAWMNLTWFASAYDVDDAPYRVLVFVQMTGALIFAAGVPALAELDLTVGVVGYVVMRVALVLQWIRAGRGDPERRACAHRYAIGISAAQAGWVLLLFAPEEIILPGFIALAAVELLVPAWAEARMRTTWHPHHITERYGLLTIIVLGESVLAATLGIQAALAGGQALVELLPTIGGGLLILYSMWWVYFDRPVHDLLTSLPRAFVWGYGHYFVYAAAAAVGAGLAVTIDVVTEHAAAGARAAGFAVAIPVAIYLLTLWVLHHRPRHDSATPEALTPITIVVVLLAPLTPYAVPLIGLILAAVLALKIFARHRLAVSGSA
jgi:low temperature requirement protein LtrA